MYIYTYMYIYTHVTYVYYYFRWDVFRLRLLDLERNIPSVRHCSSSEIRQFHGNRTFLDPHVGIAWLGVFAHTPPTFLCKQKDMPQFVRRSPKQFLMKHGRGRVKMARIPYPAGPAC